MTDHAGTTDRTGTAERVRLEAAVRAFFAGAGALGLGAAFEVKTGGGEGREALRVVVTPPEPGAPGPRRWAPVANALQTLLDASLAAQGFVDPPVEVSLRETVVEGRPPPVREDVGLVAAARALAETSARLGRPFALGPMAVADRRQVHQALGDVPQVWTQSEGEGIFRRLWIVPRPPRPAAGGAGQGGSGSPARGGGDEPVA